MALPRQLKEIRFDSGLNTKGDRRAQPEQLLDIATNVEFDDVGGLRCRFPFDNVRSAIVGGGTLADARRFALNGEELVCFTKDKLYSWVPALEAWDLRGDHLAVATDEQTVFATPGDQDYADRAELAGHVVYCWQTVSDGVRIAVRDKTTGAVVQGPTTIRPTPGDAYIQPRLVALDTCVILFWIHFIPLGTTTLLAAKITVNPYTYTVAGAPIATVTNAASTFNYDVCRIPGQDRCYAALADSGAVGNHYSINEVNPTFTGLQTVGTMHSSPSSNPIAIAVSPDHLFCTVVNGASDRVYAEIWNVTAAGTHLTFVAGETRLDTTAATQIGSLSQITAAYRLTQDGGHYRCYVFWSRDESDTIPATTVFESCVNWIDSTNTIGVDVPFVYGLGVAARAFARDSHVYLVGVFAGLSFAPQDPSGTFSELQNTYYLYRDDAFLVAKAVWGEAGGFHTKGWLPNVTADAGDADALIFMGEIRRIVPIGANTTGPIFAKNYAERAPREVTFTFDDNRARRSVRFGETLYVLGGLVLQYDGAQIVELGTPTYPWQIDTSNGGAGAIAAAGYSYKATDRWANAKGELDRSTTATVTTWTSPGTEKSQVLLPNVFITRKTGIAIEIWRTKGNPVAGAPFFLATSQDPSDFSGDNDYLTSDPTSSDLIVFVDNLTDAAISVLPANPENGAVLPALEPPPATIAYTDNQRVYLAGIPGYPNTVYYSKYRQPGLVAAFSDVLTFDVPASGGAITRIDYLDGALIVWCETATFAFAGVGFDDTGGGANFQLSRVPSQDLGCVDAESAELFDGGFLVKTGKGWFVFDRALNYEGNYVGAGVYKYDAETVLAMIVLTARHQVRFLTSGRMLVFDTLVKQWAETSVADGLDMLLWNDAPAYLTATGPRAELATWDGYGGTDYTLTEMDIESSWMKFGDLQARAIVDFVQLLGELRSTCVIRKRLAKDYEAVSPGVWSYHTDKTWTPAPGTLGSALQVRQAPRWKRCESLKARFTVTAPDGASPLGGPCARLTSITIPFALEPNAYSAVSAAQKQ